MPEGAAVVRGHHTQIVEVDPADRLVIVGLRGVFVFDRKLPAQLLLHDLRERERLAEIVALQLGAADLLQKVHLRFGLHALAERVHAQRRGHLHELREDDLPVVALVELTHEAHIELEQVKADALQHVQRGIAAAEVVHPHGEAELLEARDLLLDEIKVAADDALRDLDGDHTAADAGGVDALADLLHHVAGVEVGA